MFLVIRCSWFCIIQFLMSYDYVLHQLFDLEVCINSELSTPCPTFFLFHVLPNARNYVLDFIGQSMLYAQLSLLVWSFSGDNCAKFLYTYFTIYAEFLNLDLLAVDYINPSCILRLEDMFKLWWLILHYLNWTLLGTSFSGCQNGVISFKT